MEGFFQMDHIVSLTVRTASSNTKGGIRLWSMDGTENMFLAINISVVWDQGQSYTTSASKMGTVMVPTWSVKALTIASLPEFEMMNQSFPKTIIFAWESS